MCFTAAILNFLAGNSGDFVVPAIFVSSVVSSTIMPIFMFLSGSAHLVHISAPLYGAHSGSSALLPRKIKIIWHWLEVVQIWCFWDDLYNYMTKPPDHTMNYSMRQTEQIYPNDPPRVGESTKCTSNHPSTPDGDWRAPFTESAVGDKPPMLYETESLFRQPSTQIRFHHA